MSEWNKPIVEDVADSPAAANAGRSRDRASWHGAAFVLESMLLIVFLAVSLAVLAAVFAGSQQSGLDAIRLTDAVTLATSGAENGAEDFASDPEAAYEEGTTVSHYVVAGGSVSKADESADGACEVVREVEARPTDAGVVYDARVTVSFGGDVIYELKTSSYVSDRGNADGADMGAMDAGDVNVDGTDADDANFGEAGIGGTDAGVANGVSSEGSSSGEGGETHGA